MQDRLTDERLAEILSHAIEEGLDEYDAMAQEIQERREQERRGNPAPLTELQEAMGLLTRARDAMEMAESNEQMRCEREISHFLVRLGVE